MAAPGRHVSMAGREETNAGEMDGWNKIANERHRRRSADRLPEARYGFGLGANFISTTGCSSQIVAARMHFLPRGLGSPTWWASKKTWPVTCTYGGCCMTEPQRDGSCWFRVLALRKPRTARNSGRDSGDASKAGSGLGTSTMRQWSPEVGLALIWM